MLSKKIGLLVSGSLLIGAAVACGHKIDKAKNDKPASQVTDPNKPKTPANPAAPTADEGKAGQPGKIILTLAALNDDKSAKNDLIDVFFRTGKDKDGKAEELTAMKPQLVQALESADEKTLKEIKDLKTFTNLGCSEDQLKNVTLTDLKEEKANDVQEDGLLVVRANVVAICGAAPNATMTLINADTLFLAEAKASVRAVGNNESITLRANRLILQGLSEITATEAESNTPSTDAGIRIAVVVGEKIEARQDGSLSLAAIGSSAIKKAATAQPQAAAPTRQEAQR